MKKFIAASLAACCMLGTSVASAQEFIFIYPEITGNTNTGFDDPTAVTSDITGTATTLGNDRKACFEAAAAVWANHLDIDVPIRVEATFSAQGGTAFSAPLGFAGPTTGFFNFTGAPQTGTIYPVALANQLFGADLSALNDIEADFNSDVDNNVVLGTTSWYYGIDGIEPPQHIDFFSTAMHELGHGLGFLSFVNPSTGVFASNTPDVFARQLRDTNITPNSFVAMSVVQRLGSIIGNNLEWNGAAVVAEKGGAVDMYAPSILALGSSVSHWDTDVSPNELMEPFATDAFTDIGLELQAFEDMGWPLDPVVTEGEGEEGEGGEDPLEVLIMNLSGGSTVEEGDTISLNSTIVSGIADTFQWMKNGADIATATSASFTKANVVPGDAGTYRLRVESPAKAVVVSNPIVISIVPVGGLPVGGPIAMMAVSLACAIAGATNIRRRK